MSLHFLFLKVVKPCNYITYLGKVKISAIQKQKHKNCLTRSRMAGIWPKEKSILPLQDGPAEVKGARLSP